MANRHLAVKDVFGSIKLLLFLQSELRRLSPNDFYIASLKAMGAAEQDFGVILPVRFVEYNRS